MKKLPFGIYTLQVPSTVMMLPKTRESAVTCILYICKHQLREKPRYNDFFVVRNEKNNFLSYVSEL